jgi:predicted exporter
LPNKSAVAIYLAVMALALYLFSPQKISTDLLTIFPQNTYTNRLKDASSLESLNRLVIISKGFDSASRKRIETIASKLEKIAAVESLFYKADDLNSEISRYLQKSYTQRCRIRPEHLKDGYIHKKLGDIYTRMSTSFLFTPINTYDPLELFADPLKSTPRVTKNGYFIFSDRGYMLSAMLNIAVSDVTSSQKFYDEIHELTEEYGDNVTVFAPHFFTAENSRKIKGEVNLIITATMLLLLLFYLFSLRDFKILILSSLALASSLFVGFSAVSALFDSVSVFTLAFGSAIAMMAVDYLFHYYFHGFYTDGQKEYKKVLYAFLTTAGGFAVLTFADFPLIRQLSVFAIAALLFSYFQFTFLFSKWRLVPSEKRLRLPSPAKGYFKPQYLLLTALLLLSVGASQLNFDGDLRKLDYRNSALLSLQDDLKGAANSRLAVLIYADSLDGVIEKAEALKVQNSTLASIADITRSRKAYRKYKEELSQIDFDKLREKLDKQGRALGFRKGLFSDSYRALQKAPLYKTIDLEIAKKTGYETKKLADGRWLSLAYIDRNDAVGFVQDKDVVLLETAKLLKQGVEGVLAQLLAISLLTMLIIAVTLYFMLGRSMLRAMNYVLLPLGIIVFVLGLSGSFSIMHLFALIIVMVAGIDYGIYMSRPEEQTDEAIYYAMLTTFAGFGIFVFSNIGALHHIGMVITLGIASTFILQRIQLRKG